MNLGELQSGGDIDLGVEDSICALLLGMKREEGASKPTGEEEEDVSENQAIAREIRLAWVVQ